MEFIAVKDARFRWLFVDIAGQLDLGVRIFYAPRVGYSEGEWADWWAELSATIARFRRASAKRVLLGDASGEIGSVASESTGQPMLARRTAMVRSAT